MMKIDTGRASGSRNRAMVSVIVPLRNDEFYIRECLESLARQTYPAAKLEVIVVDGDSEDKSLDIVQEFINDNPNFILKRNTARIVPAARNIGIMKATGQFIGMVDSHAYLDADYIKLAVSTLTTHIDIDCVGGIMKTVGEGYLGQAISTALSSQFGVGNSAFRTDGRERLVDTVPFGVYRREVFEEIGLFDERLARNEDNDLHWRLRQHGGKILLTPKINSYYHPPSTLPKLCRQAFRNGLWNIRMLRLGRRGLACRHLVPLVFFLGLAGAIFLRSLGRQEPLVIIGLLYLFAATIASIGIGRKIDWRFTPILPIVFLLMHLSYGIGSGAGLLETVPGLSDWRPGGSAPAKAGPTKQAGKV